MVAGQKRRIDRLQAGWTDETSHQPLIHAVHVKEVHTRQVANLFVQQKVAHTDRTPRKRGEISSIVGKRRFSTISG